MGFEQDQTASADTENGKAEPKKEDRDPANGQGQTLRGGTAERA